MPDVGLAFFFYIHHHFFIFLTKILYNFVRKKWRKNFIIRFVAIFCTLMLCLMTFFNERVGVCVYVKMYGWEKYPLYSYYFLVKCTETRWCLLFFFLFSEIIIIKTFNLSKRCDRRQTFNVFTFLPCNTLFKKVRKWEMEDSE